MEALGKLANTALFLLRRLGEEDDHDHHDDHDEDHHDDAAKLAAAAADKAEKDKIAKQLRDAKIGLIVCVGVVALAFSLLPYVMKRIARADHAHYIQVFAALSAGVIFGSLMTTLIPEAQELMTAYFKALPESNAQHEWYEFPWGTLLICISFSVLLCIETLVSHAGLHAHNHSHGHAGGEALPAVPQAQVVHAGKGEEKAATDAPHGEHVHAHVCSEHVAQVIIAAAAASGHDHGAGKGGEAASDSGSEEVSTEDPAKVDVVAVNPMTASQTPILSSAPHASHHHHGHTHAKALARAYVFILAISLHSILDGLSIGAAKEVKSFTTAVIAVVSHKAFDGLALGIPVFLSNMSWKLALSALVFCAAMTPIGIGIGWAATDGVNGKDSVLAQGLILGLAGGSYLYVALTELLPTALSSGKRQPVKLLAFTAGWLAMAILAGYMPHDHGHAGEAAHGHEEEAGHAH